MTLALFATSELWRKVSHDDPRAAALADRHYSRQSPGERDFTPPGRKLVLLSHDESAVWAAVENLDPAGALRFRCTIFRNEGRTLSSELIREATSTTLRYWQARYHGFRVPLTTEIDPGNVRKKRDPGRCFLRAGWIVLEASRRGLVVLLAPPPVLPWTHGGSAR
jgi:hypothetical protein